MTPGSGIHTAKEAKSERYQMMFIRVLVAAANPIQHLCSYKMGHLQHPVLLHCSLHADANIPQTLPVLSW